MSVYGFPTVTDLARDMADHPSYYGFSAYRDNPCCQRDQLRIEFAHNPFHEHYDDIEAAVFVAEALKLALLMLADQFQGPTSNITTADGPCESCLAAGDVDPTWLAARPGYAESR